MTFVKRPEYIVNQFTLVFSKLQDGLTSVPDVSLSVADIYLLGKCNPVVKFSVDGSQFSKGAWVVDLVYEGAVYDSKIIEVWDGKPLHTPAGSGVLESVTIL